MPSHDYFTYILLEKDCTLDIAAQNANCFSRHFVEIDCKSQRNVWITINSALDGVSDGSIMYLRRKTAAKCLDFPVVSMRLSKNCMWLRETKPLLRKRSKSRLPSTKRLFSLRDNEIVLLFVDKQIVS